MIQEASIKSDQKPIDASPSSSPSSAGATPESLRCPRCDSSNTKFCYYNNYNLTQPRHFCKTCRRYWTKGGALRNVPIGGGCRKNKTASIAAAVRNSPGKLKALSSEIARTGLFDTAHHHHHQHQHFSANPNLLWGPPHSNNTNSHFLSLLRANQNPNHNNYPNNNNFRVSGIDPALGSGHAPFSLYRNQTNHGEFQHNGIQDLYPKLRSSPSTGCYFPENAPLIGNLTSASYSPLGNSGILDSAPVGTAGELGFWNASNLSLPADNGVYPS